MSRRRPKSWAVAALLAVTAALGAAAQAETPEAATAAGPEEAVPAPVFTAKGADTCLKCHDEDTAVPVLSIFKTAHARTADSRTPFAGHQCEACHGAGDTHARGGNKDPVPPIRNFGIGKDSPVAEQNAVCMSCHQGGHRTQWPGSAHDRADIPCAACHQVHAPQDPALTTASQPEVCYACHRKERAEMMRPSAHPVNPGKLACSDCHAVHGAPGDALLASPTINQTCYRCHAEKRGPFLWEHAPASEDCGLCHVPHGSNQPALLVQRPPWLCQSCHAAEGHPSVAYSGAGLSTDTASAFLLGQSCGNCHSQVHGTNHPSGATLTR